MLATVTWILLTLSVLIALSIPIILKYQANTGQDSLPSNKAKKGIKDSLRELWGINDIKSGVISLTSNRYRLIMRVSSADIFLLSVTEQTNVEDSLISVLMGLSFPMQILITAEAVDTRNIINDIRKNMSTLNANMRDYAGKFITHMEGLKSQKTAAMRSAYIVIPFDTNKGLEYAHIELMARASTLADGLRVSKMNCEVLSTKATVDLLYHLLNRGNLWRPSEADSVGVMDLFHVSERQVSIQDDKTA